MRSTEFDVVVIGGGHAGAEAAWAAASALGAGGKVALVTMDPAKIGVMSCNPAIGGLAKGQMVREIDALGGLMGLATDATGILFKMLNTSKGAAVRGPRAQCDKYAYSAEVQRLIATRENVEVIAGVVDEIVVEDGKVVGVRLPARSRVVRADWEQAERNVRNEGLSRAIYRADEGMNGEAREGGWVIRTKAVVLTTGTFMRALMHTGEQKTEGGRVNEGSAVGISGTLKRMGFALGRLKTGTPPRLARESIDWESLPVQKGDEPAVAFSDLSPGALSGEKFPQMPQAECRMSRTTAEIHEVIKANIHRAPMYSGQIDAECGPRYCPSIEDKVVRFGEREAHHVFLEPESLHTNEIYCNGISTSLPADVQERIVHGMPGCEKAEILRHGYAVEYDMVWPHQIDSTGMTKLVEGLFLAGQINGTSGYEEAAGQGLVAGVNAARLVMGKSAVRLGREQAYIGVMMDDLVTRTPREPYRMFTSRAEHRLLLRADNADERLTMLGREWGLVCDKRMEAFERRMESLREMRARMEKMFIEGKTVWEMARRPETTTAQVREWLNVQDAAEAGMVERAMTESRYEGYVVRQQADIRRQAQSEEKRIPTWVRYEDVSGMRTEAKETLKKFQPVTMGQAGRLAGVTPADLALLAVVVKRGPKREAAGV